MKRDSQLPFIALLFATLSASLVASCVGTETGNPPAAPVTMALRTSDPAIASPAPGPGVVIDEAWLTVASVRTIEGATCDRVAPEPSVQNVSGDLARGVPTDGLPAGRFCAVQVSLQSAAALPSGAPPAFAGRALLVRGRGTDGVPFEAAVEAPTTLQLRAVSAELPVVAGDTFVLTFDVARWMSGIALDTIVPDADGVRRIVPGHAPSDTFALNLASSADLFVDADGDGVLAPAEQAAGAVALSH